MDIVELILPAYFACYLVYGDGSGLNEHEAEEIDNYLQAEGLRIVGCPDGEPEFRHRNDFNSLGADCLTFTATCVVA